MSFAWLSIVLVVIIVDKTEKMSVVVFLKNLICVVKSPALVREDSQTLLVIIH